MLGIVKRKFSTLLSLGPTRFWVFLKSLLLIPLVGLLVKVVGYNYCRRLLGITDNAASANCSNAELLAQIESGFWLALKYSPYRGACLSQCLALMSLLQQQNFPTILRIGVITVPEGVKAHAWLESGDAVMQIGSKFNHQWTSFDTARESATQQG
jgi:hypothetical protein